MLTTSLRPLTGLVPVLGITAAMLVVAPVDAAPSTTVTTLARQGDPTRVFEKHPFLTHEQGVDHPAAATYVDGAGVIAVAEHRRGGTEITLLNPSSNTVTGRMTLHARIDTLADDGHGNLTALDGRRFLSWSASARGQVTPDARPIVGTAASQVGGMTYDPGTGRWLVLDQAGQDLVVLDAGGSTVRGSAGPTLRALGAKQLGGIAVDPSNDRIYVADSQDSRLYAVDGRGRQVAVLDTSDVEVTSLASLAFGATADPTDAGTAMSLYAADAGRGSTFGRVAEVSLTPLGAAAVTAATTSSATLVRKSLLSQLNPPAPDSSGIVYMSDLNRLFVADSEVDEMTIYQGVNLWQISRDDTQLFDKGNTLKFSKEPTGIGYDPVGKRMFISDDDKKRVFEVTAGPDNRFGTADDPVTFISTSAFGDSDPEDVTYDTSSGDLFLTQGVGQEVWRVSPGPNRRFDGVAPTGDDTVSHFDAAVYGITDLEGIGYSPTRDSLFLADRKFTKIIEVTKSGALVQSIDVSTIGMNNPAAITMAPATNDPTRSDLYVVTRGVDNDNHPTENDGTMYELSAPNLGAATPSTNQAPAVSAGPDLTVTMPDAATLDGTITDDGLPNPPGTVTSTWTKVSGPGTVTFANSAAVDTTASFSSAGTYVLRLSGSDSDLSRADDVTVLVNPAPTSGNVAPSVSAGPDVTVTMPDPATLDGTITDDGLPNPPGTVTSTWTKVSGPGTVTFANSAAVDTTASFSSAGTYVLRLSGNDSQLTTTDDVTVTVNAAPTSGNLVTNPGFETDTTGWKGSAGTTLTRVAQPHTGSWSGQLANTGTTSTTCQLNDSPNWVGTTTTKTYTATAWVKGDAAGAGSSVRLRFREYVGQTGAGSKEAAVTLTTGWQQITLSYTPSSPGSTLDLNLVRSSTPAGAVCFFTDDVTVSTS